MAAAETVCMVVISNFYIMRVPLSSDVFLFREKISALVDQGFMQEFLVERRN